MKFKYIINILAFVLSVKSNEIRSLTTQILKEVKPNEVTIFLNFANRNSTSSYEYSEFIEYLMGQVKTSLIDLNNPPQFIEKDKYNKIEYKHNISADLHFIFINEKNLTKFENKFEIALQLIEDSLFYLTETKICLLL